MTALKNDIPSLLEQDDIPIGMTTKMTILIGGGAGD